MHKSVTVSDYTDSNGNVGWGDKLHGVGDSEPGNIKHALVTDRLLTAPPPPPRHDGRKSTRRALRQEIQMQIDNVEQDLLLRGNTTMI